MPKFSVIVPTYNRGHLISRAIESIFAQTFNDFEIIVIDDGSTDDTKKILDAYQGKIRYCHQKNQGVSAARNHGIREARGEFLSFTDDDVIVDPYWLAAIDKCFRENRCDIVGGRVLPIFPDGTPVWVRENPAKISGGVVIYDYGEKIAPFDLSHFRFITANFSARNEIFADCGVFRTDLIFEKVVNIGEDIEFMDRALKNNKILYYCGQALVHHPVYLNRLNLKHAARWNTAWGCFCAREEAKENKHFTYWFGAPRYLWKGVIIDFFRLCCSVFDRLALYDACRSYFRKVGMIREYRRMSKKGIIQ
jgi:glycosyltransferase involved in cell wall biosynthesis